MQQRNIAFIGLKEQSVQACMSMLGITTSMSAVSWSRSEPGDASVVLTSSENRHLVPSNKTCVVVYRVDQQTPNAAYTLSQPFRARSLVALLDKICRQQEHATKNNVSEHPPSANEPVESTSCQALAKLMMSDADSCDVFALETSVGDIFVAPARSSFFADDAVKQQLDSTGVSFVRLSPHVTMLPDGLVARSIFYLAWYMAASVDPLFSWIDADASFQLKRWPYFGGLPRNRERLTLSALLNRRPMTYQQLLEATNCGEQSLNHFLNACAISGLLVITESSEKPLITTSSTSRLGGLIRGLRSRLGLVGRAEVRAS